MQGVAAADYDAGFRFAPLPAAEPAHQASQSKKAGRSALVGRYSGSVRVIQAVCVLCRRPALRPRRLHQSRPRCPLSPSECPSRHWRLASTRPAPTPSPPSLCPAQTPARDQPTLSHGASWTPSGAVPIVCSGSVLLTERSTCLSYHVVSLRKLRL